MHASSDFLTISRGFSFSLFLFAWRFIVFCSARNETTAGDNEPVKQPFVPGMMDPADSLNLEVMSDEEFHKMSQGLFSSQDDDPASPESADSECSGGSSGSGSGSSLLSSLGGRELTAADMEDGAAAESRPMYAAPFDPSLRSTTTAPAASTGGGNGYVGGGGAARGQDENESGGRGQQQPRVRKIPHCWKACLDCQPKGTAEYSNRLLVTRLIRPAW